MAKNKKKNSEDPSPSTETEVVIIEVGDEETSVPQESAAENVDMDSQDLFKKSAVWGESNDLVTSPEPPPLITGDEELVDVPPALTHLEDVGFRFQRVPDEMWKITNNAAHVYRNCSVIFSVDTVCTSQDILFGFDKADIDIDYITSVQRRNSSCTWVVSVISQEHKDYALEISSITICGCEVFLGHAENQTVIVKVYEAPNEMPDTALIGMLSCYGKVLSFRSDCIATGIYNGVRTARMRLQRPIPSTMRVVGEQVMMFYESQPRTCHHCGDEGYMANGCKAPHCFNCEKAGHRAEDCPEPELCRVCFSAEHFTCRSPFIVHSANIQARVEGQGSASYAAAVQDRLLHVKQPPSQLRPKSKRLEMTTNLQLERVPSLQGMRMKVNRTIGEIMIVTESVTITEVCAGVGA